MVRYLPRFVEVPENLTMAEVEKAVGICIRLGLLENRAGYMIIPHGIMTRVEYQPGDERA